MAQYRIKSLAELARQMQFTPLETRAAQVAAAEELLHSLDSLQVYPTDFVVFRITGYRPREVNGLLLTGLALQHDLGLLIEHVSDTLDLRTDALSEPVLQIEDVTDRFNVTSKTIQRWRRKGLPARRFIFADGKRRVGFLISSVERFFAAHQDQVAQGANFSVVDDAEREIIVSRARRLAVACRCCEAEISRRIGKKLNRSPATILHTIRKHDQDHPAAAIMPLAGAAISQDDRTRIARGHRKGLPLRIIARRLRQNRSAVYRVLMEERMAKLNRRKTKFIDDPLYHQDDAESAIETIARQDDVMGSGPPEESRVPRDLPPYLQDLYRTPLLSAAKERALFLKFNFHKFQFVSARRKLEPQFARTRELHAMEKHLRDSVDAKNAIVRANLRLVVSVARKHLRPGLSLMELISEGNLVLMRAVEGFDIHRGYRFSTYATLALMKGFARGVPQMLAGRSSGGDEIILESVPDYRNRSQSDRFANRDQVGDLLTRLDDRERAVLLAHYGLGDRAIPATFDEVGEKLGLSAQRVRQIEKSAIAKLRQVAGVVVPA
ncbi:MAG TPA: sigma-70 family RNA polymerase sigma factor [Tepidisphaeraceae bacterium]|nr:sigma-70 family RNA polymerase sigma factor [Tepidisphaeraceae bacterium]